MAMLTDATPGDEDVEAATDGGRHSERSGGALQVASLAGPNPESFP